MPNPQVLFYFYVFLRLSQSTLVQIYILIMIIFRWLLHGTLYLYRSNKRKMGRRTSMHTQQELRAVLSRCSHVEGLRFTGVT